MEDPVVKNWEVVLKYVDIPTLLTARLVSKKACSAASRLIKRIGPIWNQGDKISWFLGASPSNLYDDLRPFPCLESVALSLTRSSPTKELVSSGVLARVTHLGVYTRSEDVAPLCDSADLVDNLVRLSWFGKSRVNPTMLYSFQKLQDLSIHKFNSLESYGPIFWLTSLTSLRIPLPTARRARRQKYSLARASALVELQKLTLDCPPGCPLRLLRHFNNMVSLTELVLNGRSPDDKPLRLLWLTSLGSLRKLKLCSDLPKSRVFADFHATQETLGVIGRMVRMADLEFPLAPGCDPSVLGALTGLTRLSLCLMEDAECSLESFDVMSLSELQYLEWMDHPEITGASLSVLCSATKLTSLKFQFENIDLQLDLQIMYAIARLTNLKSLNISFNHDDPRAIDCGVALRPLKGLTYLECQGGGMNNTDFKSVSRLASLRVLSVCDARNVTAAILSDLTALTCLDRLEFRRTGIVLEDITYKFHGMFNDHRLERGWPPIDIEVGN